MVIQTVSVVGAVMVLAAYAMIQGGLWKELDRGYLVLNVVGSLLLGVVAVMERQVGFVLLEFAWMGLAIWGVIRAFNVREKV